MIRNYLPVLLLGVLSPLFLLAQDYTPVIINGGVFFKTELLTSDGLIAAEITVANFEKINGELYNRVFFKRGLEADMLIGYFREDNASGQLHYRPLTGNTDILVYDISLEVGDVIELPARWCDGQNNDQAEVVSVSEVDGLRQLVFDREVGEGDLCQTLTFLEGVGPSATLMFPYFRDAIIQNGVAQRICHASHEGEIYYPGDVEVDLCGFATVDTEDFRKLELKVFPNPVNDQLKIEHFNPGDEIRVFNFTGQQLAYFAATSTIDTGSWPDGIYFIQLTSSDGATKVARVIKQ